MDNITKQQAVEIIKKAFELKEFSERIEGGQCRIESMTLLWTIVHIENRPKKQSE